MKLSLKNLGAEVIRIGFLALPRHSCILSVRELYW